MIEKKDYNHNSSFHFKIENMDKDEFILERVKQVNLSDNQSKAYTNILKFLYKTDHNKKTTRITNRKYIQYLTEVEKMLLFRLEIRSSGSERYRYGINSVLAIKKAKYKCEVCSEKDIRCLEIDHKNGRKKPIDGTKYIHYEIDEFQCLCANHHKIKTLIESQQN